MRDLVVWKFGGTSLAGPERLRAVAERLVAAHRDGRRVVAVLSAMGDETDRLLRAAQALSRRPPARELDALLALGECRSCALAAVAVQDLGVPAVSLTGAQAGILTDGSHGAARVRAVRPQRILAALDGGQIVLVAGFQGVSPDGEVTTLGRGGSDASAVALAAALGVRTCEIFTDVDGVLTADPRVVPTARRIAELGHDEMLLLADAGATVLQPRSVELAATHDIDVHVRSSFTAHDGTRIRSDGATLERVRVLAIAHRAGDPLYAVSGRSSAPLVAALEAAAVTVGTVVRRGRELCFTAPGAERSHVTAALAGVRVRAELGAVSLVGTGIGTRPEVTARALAALARAGIEPQLATNCPGRAGFHVPAQAVTEAARVLHRAFRLDEPRITALAEAS